MWHPSSSLLLPVVHFLFWKLAAFVFSAAFPPNSLAGLAFSKALSSFDEVKRVLSAIQGCDYVFMCVRSCGWWCTHHPFCLHVHEWRMWMLLPTQETLFHSSAKKRYTPTHLWTHTLTHTQAVTYEAWLCMMSPIPITIIPSISVARLPDQNPFEFKWFTHHHIYPSFYSVLYCSLCSSAILQAAADPGDTWMSDSWQKAVWQRQVRHGLETLQVSNMLTDR